MSYCGDNECSASSGIHEGLTFGKGRLDDDGYWEYPCWTCARACEKENPGEICWPFEGMEWDQTEISKEFDEEDERDKELEAELDLIRSWHQ